VIAAMGLVMVIVFTCVCTRIEWCPGYYANEAKLQRKRLRTAQALRQHRRQLGFYDLSASGLLGARNGDDSDSGYANQASPVTGSSIGNGIGTPGSVATSHDADGAAGSGYHELLPGNGTVSRMHGSHKHRRRIYGRRGTSALLQKDCLCEGDIPFHLTRIYFDGTNSTSDPWRMPRAVPSQLRGKNFLDEAKYGEMVDKVNALGQHSRVTGIISAILHVLCYPLGYMYMKRQRKIRGYILREFFETYDHACVNNTRARALMNTFKFGQDGASLLAYVDVLGARPIDPLSREARLPMLLFLAGDGSYWSPFHVDWDDLLVRAVPQLVELRIFIDQTWADMIAVHLNAALRPLDPTMLERKSLRALRVLEHFQSREQEVLGGLTVRLGLFATPGSSETSRRRLALILERDGPSTPPPPVLGVAAGQGMNGTSQTTELHHTLEVAEPPPQALDKRRGSSFSSMSAVGSMLSMSQADPGALITHVLSDDQKRAGQAAVRAFEEEERLHRAEAELESNPPSPLRSVSQPPSPRHPERPSPRVTTENVLRQGSIEPLPSPGGIRGEALSLVGNQPPSQQHSLGQLPDSSPMESSLLQQHHQVGSAQSVQSNSNSSGGGNFNPNGTTELSTGLRRPSILAETQWGLEQMHELDLEADSDDAFNYDRGGDASGESTVDDRVGDFTGRVLSMQAVLREIGADFDDGLSDDSQSNESCGGLGTWWGAHGCSWNAMQVLPARLRQSLGVLSNRAPRKRDSQLVWRAFISALLAVDVACTFMLMTSLFCVDHVEPGRCSHALLIAINFMYPLALVVGPLLGLTFVVFPLSGMGRHYAVWNTLAVLNALLACILCAAFRDSLTLETSIAAALLLLVKILQSRVVDRYVALIELDRGRRRASN